VSCEQEWYAYFDGQLKQALLHDQKSMNDPSVAYYMGSLIVLKAKIEAQDADPHALIANGDDSSDSEDGSFDSGNDNSSDSGNSAGNDAPDNSAPTESPAATPASVLVDAIGAAAPIVPSNPMEGWALGEYEIDDNSLLGALINGLLNGALRDKEDQASYDAMMASGAFGGATFGGQLPASEGTTACPKKGPTDGEVPHCKR
jgi:hypothetical protein